MNNKGTKSAKQNSEEKKNKQKQTFLCYQFVYKYDP